MYLPLAMVLGWAPQPVQWRPMRLASTTESPRGSVPHIADAQTAILHSEDAMAPSRAPVIPLLRLCVAGLYVGWRCRAASAMRERLGS